MSESMLIPVSPEDDSEFDLESFEAGEFMDESIETPRGASIEFFSNEYIQVGTVVYELDQVESKILEVLRRSKGSVSEETIIGSLFGTAEGGASDARRSRYRSALATFNGIEQETTSAVYDWYLDENDDVHVERLFKSKMLRRPYEVAIEEPDDSYEHEATTQDEAGNEVDTLDERDIHILRSISDSGANGGAVITDVFEKLLGTKNPSFEDEVKLMQEIKHINGWLDRREFGLEISRWGSLKGPVFGIKGTEIEYLAYEVEQENLLILAETKENERLRLAEDRITLTKTKKAEGSGRVAKRPARTAVEATENKGQANSRSPTGMPFRSNFRYGAAVATAETENLIRVAEETNLDERLLFSTRLILGYVYSQGVHVRLEDEGTLIRFWQETNNDEHCNNREISHMTEASFGAMVQRHGFRIRKMARRLAVKPEHYEDLLLAGLEGFEDSMKRYDAERGSGFQAYSGLRVHGEMIDSIRRENEKPRHAENWQRPLSLDASPPNNTDQNGVTLLDTLPHVDTENKMLMNAIEMPVTEVRSQLLEAMNRAVDNKGRINRVSERDLTIMLMDFGTTHLMNEEQLKLYKELVSRNRPHETLRRQIWEHYGITEARISQIVDQSTNRLGNILEAQREELFPE